MQPFTNLEIPVALQAQPIVEPSSLGVNTKVLSFNGSPAASLYVTVITPSAPITTDLIFVPDAAV